MGFQGLTGFGGGAASLSVAGGAAYPPDSFWVRLFEKGDWQTEYTEQCAGDLEGNVYMSAIRYSAGGQGYKGVSIIKVDVEGALSWQKVQYSNPTGTSMENLTLCPIQDGTAVYTAGQSDFGLNITKWDSSDGSELWTKLMGNSSANNKIMYFAKVSDGNPISWGTNYSPGSGLMFLTKFDSSGSQTWISGITGSTTSVYPDNGMQPKIDSSGNIHTTAYQQYSGTKYCGVLKHDSLGALQSATDYLLGTDEDMFRDIAVDSAGNKYILFSFKAGSAPLYRGGIMKVNSSDVIQWQKEVYNGVDSTTITPMQVDVTSTGEMIARFFDWKTNMAIIFIRFQADGTIVYKREFKLASGGLGAYNGTMQLNRNDNIIFNTSTTGTVNQILGQLPGDGSLTGTHGNYEWNDATSITVGTYSGWTKQASSIFSSTSSAMAMSALTTVQEENNVTTSTLEVVD